MKPTEVCPESTISEGEISRVESRKAMLGEQNQYLREMQSKGSFRMFYKDRYESSGRSQAVFISRALAYSGPRTRPEGYPESHNGASKFAKRASSFFSSLATKRAPFRSGLVIFRKSERGLHMA
jgi:hypothetical protein